MGRKTNLHAVWDTGIIEQRISKGDWIVWGNELVASITPENLAEFAASRDPLAWANESLKVTRTLYAELDSDEIGVTYYDRSIPVVEVQLERAGVRLAGLLNTLFAVAPAATAPSDRPAPAEPEGQ
jgi:hypothetical protein